jgi:hypothetical protein
LQSQLIQQVVEPGLINQSDASYVDAFAQMLFHILLLRFLILAWPNDDPRVFELHVPFIDIFLDELTIAVSLCGMREPCELDAKDCRATFASQILIESTPLSNFLGARTMQDLRSEN